MKGLYEHHIIHRDIKPENILIKNGVLKLGDFGFCKRLSSNELTQTSLGSPLYMAPEVLNNDVYSTKADIWSCGIVLYQIFFGECPYGTCNIQDLLRTYNIDKTQHNMHIEIPKSRHLSPIIEIMMNRMLCKDQFKRISWDEFLYEYEFEKDNLNGK